MKSVIWVGTAGGGGAGFDVEAVDDDMVRCEEREQAGAQEIVAGK